MDHHEAGKYGIARRRELEELGVTAREAYEADPKKCLFCGEIIPFEKRFGKFCNKSCSASYNNRGVTRHATRSEFCANCGKRKERRQNKYCRECSDKQVYHRPQTFAEAKDHVARKRFLIDQRGHRCECCGLIEWLEQPIPLELHHVDGDSDNNTEENLQLLCPNCHAFTDNYKGANKGKNGARQKWRRARYAKGLSW